MKPIDLAYYILNNYNNVSEEGITPLKIQKLLYYVYVWGIVSNNEIFDEKFKKWNFGPVLPEVYYEFKSYGKSPIEISQEKKIYIDENNKFFIDFIVSNYIKFDAITLSSMTHQDAPWKLTNNDQEISKELIKQFYSKLNFAKNLPFNSEKPYYPVATDLHYSFILDFSSNSPESAISYKSYDEYLKIVKKAKTEFKNEFSKWLAV